MTKWKRIIGPILAICGLFVGAAEVRAGPPRCYSRPARYYGYGASHQPRYVHRSYGYGYSYRGGGYGVRSSYLSRGYGGGYYYTPRHYYTPTPVYYSSAVVIKPPKTGPDISVTKWDTESLTDLASRKFAFSKNLGPANRLQLEIIEKDYDDDTGALRKAKFAVRWIEFVIKKDKHGQEISRTEQAKKTTCKLKFDEFARFTSYDD